MRSEPRLMANENRRYEPGHREDNEIGASMKLRIVSNLDNPSTPLQGECTR